MVQTAATSDSRFDFGGVTVAFECASPAWLAAVGERFDGFETTNEPEWCVRYAVRNDGTSADGSPGGAMPPAVRVLEPELRAELAGPGFVATLDLARRRVEIAGPPAAYPADMLLRELLPAACEGGLVVHGALLSDGERAWACCGPSGSGKSTLAALLPNRALCDELSLLRDGRGPFTGRSLPYWDARPGGAPLAGVLMLRHGADHRRRRLRGVQALRALAAEVVWPALSEAAAARRFGTLTEVVERVPVWELAFAPRADVWDAITAEA